MQSPVARDEAFDPDIEVRSARRSRGPRRSRDRHQPAVLGVIALGGGLGALGRYGVSVWWPNAAGTFPWNTFVVNLTGCLLIGVLMVLLTETLHAPGLLRPFVAVGVLGGFTTFSTYAVQVHALVRSSSAGLALGYLAATLLGALAAVTVGVAAARWVVRTTRRAALGTRGSRKGVSQ